jgi:hypothetical protein
VDQTKISSLSLDFFKDFPGFFPNSSQVFHIFLPWPRIHVEEDVVPRCHVLGHRDCHMSPRLPGVVPGETAGGDGAVLQRLKWSGNDPPGLIKMDHQQIINRAVDYK